MLMKIPLVHSLITPRTLGIHDLKYLEPELSITSCSSMFHIYVSEPCLTNGGNRCIFPFSLSANSTYTGCYHDPDYSGFWCPVSVSSDGKIEKEEKCREDCPKDCPSGFWKCHDRCTSVYQPCGDVCMPGLSN